MKHIKGNIPFLSSMFILVAASAGLLFSFQNCSNVHFSDAKVASTIDEAGTPVDVVCDPFSASSACNPGNGEGLFGNVYNLPGENDSVQRYIDYGTRLNIYVQMSDLNIPTRSWSSGFPTSEGGLLKNVNGEALIEFFALDLRGYFILPQNKAEGDYDFAIASDDGAILDIEGQTFVNNDGKHNRQWTCSNRSVYLKHGESHAVRLRYYQGPRVEIALQVYMRPTSKRGQACDDDGGWTILPPQMLHH